jgi:signal transduction histidine kinase
VKRPFFYILIIGTIFLLGAHQTYGQMEGIRVQVLDQQGNPLAGEAISIENSDYFLPDDEGIFFLAQKQLKVPVRASFRNEEVEIQEIAYFEEEGQLQVNATRLYQNDDILSIVLYLEGGVAADKVAFRYRGISYTTNADGKKRFQYPVRYSSGSVTLKDHKVIDEKFDVRKHQLKLMLKQLSPKQPTVRKDTIIQSYEADFERIAREIEKERILYEDKNHEIQSEILKIRDNLIQEEDIKPEQRMELKRYLNNMEKALLQNSEAIRQSEERTREVIAKLRLIIIEKDSLNMVAQGRIIQIEEEKAAAEQSYRHRITIYLSIIVGLIILALVIYLFAVKLRRQKHWLAEVNKRLKSMQLKLTTSLQEINMRKAQIEDHNNQLELFVYKASHDIKGPLRSIIGLTQLGMADVKDDAAQEYFGHIYKSTQRLDNLLADLLRLTKAKNAEVDKQGINLRAMIDEIIQSFKNIRHFDRVQINLDLPEEISFLSDEKMLYSVIQNFVENGIKYCDSKKESSYLNISVKQEKGKTTFQFRDNGLGIDEEHLPKIFDMFYKIDSGSDGTGLGLHIVKVTIEKLGGTLKVRSGKGIGSLFTLTFYDE